jgi:glycosyltransferase involved in cell wall biosynthesis
MVAKRPDIIYVYHPPVTVGLPAIVARWLYEVPIVYDIQDLWPDTVAATGMLRSSFALSMIERWCDLVYRKSDRIVVLSPGFKKALVARGVPASKIEVVYNWCDETAVVRSAPAPFQLAKPGEFVVLFAGTMGFAQGLNAVLEAARLCASAVPQARFAFVGGGAECARLQRMAADMRLCNVRFYPRQPMQAMGSLFAAADAVLVHLKDHPLFRITIPSKTQAYMAAGRPILMAVRGDAADLVARSGAGLVCEPENPNSIVSAVARLARAPADIRADMGRAGRNFYSRELSLAVGVSRFESIFRAVCQ